MLPSGAQIILEIPQPPIMEPGGGVTMIFPFTLPASGKYEIYMEQVAPRPDFSLQCWLTQKPLSGTIFTQNNIDKFNIPKHQIRFWASAGEEPPQEGYWGFYILEPNTEYFLNIKNRENAMNGFEIAFIDPDNDPFGSVGVTNNTVQLPAADAPFGVDTNIQLPFKSN